ncbi:MAG: ubiquinone biosynthesis regulatory protein kinase UbiB [Gammaproteobacteria bacterium]
MKLRVLARLLEIQRVLIRHGLDDFVRATHLYRPLRYATLLSPSMWFARRRGGSRGERLRLALQELGPIFVKFGQAVSTRRDLLPVDIADELAKLQDRVPPFDGVVARGIVEGAFGKPVAELFAEFEQEPLAAASIAQVHAAKLKNGKDVVVKVLRPGMRAVIERDLEVLYALADLAQRFWSDARRLRPVEIVGEYEKTILDELDLMREAANAAQLKRNFAGSPLLYVPEVYFDLSHVDVMVMERIRGVPISDMAALRAANADIPKLAKNGVEIFFTQVFRHNFFHADMHPGNIFVLIEDPANPRYAAIDFGIVGTLDPRDQHYLAENFLAVFDRDYRRVAVLHVESGWVPPDTRVDEMESAIRTVCEPIFDKPIKDISFGTLLLRLFDISRRFNMEIQPQLILLQKTLFNIEGLGRDLYPDLDIWNTASPILRDWMRERVGLRSLLKSWRKQWPDLVDAARVLPGLLSHVVQRAQNGSLRIRIDAPEIESLKAALRASNRRRDAITVGGVVLLCGVFWLMVHRQPEWVGWAVSILGAGWLLAAWRRQ